MAEPRTQLGCRVSTREQVLRPLLREGEDWDTLFRKMASQYDPEAAMSVEAPEFTNRTAGNYSERNIEQ